MCKKILMFSAFSVLATATCLFAQTGLGELGGFIYDEEGRVIVGANIKVTGPALMGEAAAVSGLNGLYRVIKLPPGKYTLLVSKENYQSMEVRNISIRAGRTSSFNVTLKVGEFEETIVVTHQAPILDLKSPSRSLNIDGDFLSRLPITYDREWDNVWALVPGTINEGQYGPYGNRVTVQGASIFQNVWNLDGANIGSTFTNANNVYFSPDIIKEVQVVTTGFDSSVAGAQGGYVNVVTKSGGNEFHGSATFTVQSEEWNWSNVEGGTPAKGALYLPEFNIGGPIQRDKTWFFASYRNTFRNEGYDRTPSELEVFEKLGIPKPTAKRETRGHMFFGKITHTLSDRYRLIGTFNTDAGAESNADQTQFCADGAGIKIERGGRFVSVDFESTWNDNLTSSLKLSYYDTANLVFGMGGFNEPALTRYERTYMSGGTLRGTGDYAYYNNRRGYGWGSDTENKRFEFKTDVRYFLEGFHGQHDLSFGFSATPYQKALSNGVYSDPVRIYEARDAQGNWVPFYMMKFDSQSIPSWDFKGQNFAGYFQDTWIFSDRLTFSTGLRVENQRDTVAFSITEFSPHVGFNYAVTKGLNDSIRASYGIRHHLLAGRSGVSEVTGGSLGRTETWDNDFDGTWDVTIYTPGAASQTTDPNALTNYYGDPLRYDDDIGMPYAHEFQFGYTRILPYELTFDAAFVYKINKNAQVQFNQNLIYQNGQFVGFRNEDINTDILISNDDASSRHFQSYELTLSKEFSRGWQMMASYTYQSSSLKGNWREDEPFRYMHPRSWFDSPGDYLRPHVFRLATSIILPYDITLSGNILGQSGLIDSAKFMPYGTGVDVPRFFTLSNGRRITHPFWSVRPYYQPRNKDRNVTMDNLWIINLGVGKDITIAGHRFQGQIQTFNIFNSGSSTRTGYYNSEVNQSGTPTRTPSYSWIQPPRAVQVLVKWVF